jgi:hypothetical protein
MSLVGIAPVADLVSRDVTQRLLPNHNHGIWYLLEYRFVPEECVCPVDDREMTRKGVLGA